MTNNPQTKIQDNATPAANPAGTPATSPALSEQEQSAKLNAEIKKTWNKLTDEDVRLYAAQPDQFFSNLKDKHSVSKEDAQKRMTEIKAACGSCSTDKAA